MSCDSRVAVLCVYCCVCPDLHECYFSVCPYVAVEVHTHSCTRIHSCIHVHIYPCTRAHTHTHTHTDPHHVESVDRLDFHNPNHVADTHVDVHVDALNLRTSMHGSTRDMRHGASRVGMHSIKDSVHDSVQINHSEEHDNDSDMRINHMINAKNNPHHRAVDDEEDGMMEVRVRVSMRNGMCVCTRTCVCLVCLRVQLFVLTSISTCM